MNIIQSPSKNFGSREGHAIDTIVIHCTDGYFPGDLEWLKGAPGSSVSSHYLIAPLGPVYSLVDDANTAWHAGLIVKPTINLRKDNIGVYVNPNLYSLGIETSFKLPGTYTAEQWVALKELVKFLCAKHNIPIDRKHILAHHEIRSDKVCPASLSVDTLVSELTIVTPPPAIMVEKEAFKKQIINYINSL